MVLQLRQYWHRQVQLQRMMLLSQRASVEVVELAEADLARMSGLRRGRHGRADQRAREVAAAVANPARASRPLRARWLRCRLGSSQQGCGPPRRSQQHPLSHRAVMAAIRVTGAGPGPLPTSDGCRSTVPVLLTRSQCTLHLNLRSALPDDQETTGRRTVLGYPVRLVQAGDESTPWACSRRSPGPDPWWVPGALYVRLRWRAGRGQGSGHRHVFDLLVARESVTGTGLCQA